MNSKAKKLEEQHEKILRSLVRQPENRQCFTCTTKTTPQYACTTFSIFICTTCSGVLRGFGYRVKSISYASFAPDEVKALQQRGNGLAKKYWLHSWTKEQIQKPEEGNERAINKFVEKVFETKRFVAKETVEEKAPAPPPTTTSAASGLPAPVAPPASTTWVAFDSPAPKAAPAPVTSAAAATSADPFALPPPNGGLSSAPSQPSQSPSSNGWVAFDSPAPKVAAPPAPSPAATTTPPQPQGASVTPADPFANSNNWVAFDSPSQAPPAAGTPGAPAPVATVEVKEEENTTSERKELPLDLFTMDALSPEPATTSAALPQPTGPSAAQAFAQFGQTPGLAAATVAAQQAQFQAVRRPSQGEAGVNVGGQAQAQPQWGYGQQQQYGVPPQQQAQRFGQGLPAGMQQHQQQQQQQMYGQQPNQFQQHPQHQQGGVLCTSPNVSPYGGMPAGGMNFQQQFGGAQGVNMAAMGMGQFQQPQQVQQQMYAQPQQPQQQQAMPSGVGLTSQQFGAQILQGMNQFQQQQQQQQPGLSTSPNYGTGFQQGPSGATNFSSGNPFA